MSHLIQDTESVSGNHNYRCVHSYWMHLFSKTAPNPMQFSAEHFILQYSLDQFINLLRTVYVIYIFPATQA